MDSTKYVPTWIQEKFCSSTKLLELHKYTLSNKMPE